MRNTTPVAARLHPNSDKLLRPLHAVLVDTRGLATIEFAMILPVLLAAFLSTLYFSDLLMARNKVTKAAFAVAEASAMDTSITDTDMAAILAAGRALLSPFDADASIVLTSVGPDGSGGHVVRWSDALGTSANGEGAPFTFRSNVNASFGSVTNKPVQFANVVVNYSSPLAAIWNSIPFMVYQLPVTTTVQDEAYALPLGTAGKEWTERVP
ncbi:TadE/TadG family type IV pilus assembly protein [Xanthobacter sp. DSM 14520]|uniref:TadE/TadG family type IV pilus assembly protein n=1 Tax=Xanthobacter autotrophicus (strain ATCC BAA-1158 / Py2) TaxID=78245 RepID=UPI003727F4AF